MQLTDAGMAGEGTASGHAMTGMLARPSNYGELPGVPLPVPIVTEDEDTWWATSLLELFA